MQPKQTGFFDVWTGHESRRRQVDLVDLTAPSQVKSFPLQVAAEIFYSSRRRILG